MLVLGMIITGIVLLIGSLTDIKKREVPDYLSYGYMFLCAVMVLMQTALMKDYVILLQAVFGLILGVIVGFAMFYFGQWGGGDSKLIIGLGIIIGFNPFSGIGSINLWFLFFLLAIIFVGGIYGLLFSIGLAIKHKKQFTKTFKKIYQHNYLARWIIHGIVVLGALFTLFFIQAPFKILSMICIATIFVLFYAWIFIRSVEQSCMIKIIPINQLTEGDWIYKDIKINNKYITGPKDLGISKEQIQLLKKYQKQGKIRKITIKEGIPFIPAFFFAYLLLLGIYYWY